MRELAQEAPQADDDERQQPARETSTMPTPSRRSGTRVNAIIIDEPTAILPSGECRCGACHGGRPPDSAADYFIPD
jgi:hypothetical protein